MTLYYNDLIVLYDIRLMDSHTHLHILIGKSGEALQGSGPVSCG